MTSPIFCISGFLERELQPKQINMLPVTAITPDIPAELSAYTLWLEDNIAKGRLSSWSYFLEPDRFGTVRSIFCQLLTSTEP